MLHLPALWRVGTRRLECCLEHVAHHRCFFVYFLLVPSQLQKILTVCIAIVILECYELDIVGSKWFGARCEIIFRILHEQWMSADNHVYEHRLAAAVWSCDGNMLAVAELEVNGLCQSPFWHSCHPLMYIDNLLHTIRSCIDSICSLISLSWGFW